MKIRTSAAVGLLLSLALVAGAGQAQQESQHSRVIIIHTGFLKAGEFRDLPQDMRVGYAIGLVNGLLISRFLGANEQEVKALVKPILLNVPWWARLPYAFPRHPAIERSTDRHASNRSAHRLRLLLRPKSTVPLAAVFPRGIDGRATARVSPSYLSRGLRPSQRCLGKLRCRR